MAAPARPAHGVRLVKRRILGDNEQVRWATRETKWLVFPGVIVGLAVVAFLDYVLWTGVYSSLPAIPYVSAWLRGGTKMVPYFGDGLLVVAVLLAIAAVASAFVRIWHWWRYVFAVTNFRVVHQVGILGSTFEEIPLVQVRDMIVEQSFWQRLFGYGRIRIYSLQSPPRGSEVSTPQSKRKAREAARRPRDPPGLENWWWVPKPYAIEKEIESQTELLVMTRANIAPQAPARL